MSVTLCPQKLQEYYSPITDIKHANHNRRHHQNSRRPAPRKREPRPGLSEKCTQCGHTFKAPDVEYMVTTFNFTMPQKHQNGGCIQTRQVRLFGKLTEKVHRKVGEKMEKKNNQNNCNYEYESLYV